MKRKESVKEKRRNLFYLLNRNRVPKKSMFNKTLFLIVIYIAIMVAVCNLMEVVK